MEIDKEWVHLVKKYMFDLCIPTDKKLKKGKIKSMPYTLEEVRDLLSNVYIGKISYRDFKNEYLTKIKGL